MICMLMHMFGHRIASKSPQDGQASWSPPESARDILDRRYAGGDITRDEYEKLKQFLNSTKGTR